MVVRRDRGKGTYLVIKLIKGRKRIAFWKGKLANFTTISCFDGKHGGGSEEQTFAQPDSILIWRNRRRGNACII